MDAYVEFMMQEAHRRLDALRREAEQDRLIRSCRMRRSFMQLVRQMVGRRARAQADPAPLVRPLFVTDRSGVEEGPQARCA